MSTETRARRPEPARSSPSRPHVAGLLAVAVGLVLVHHAGVRQLPGGFVGVDVMLVVAGFLVTGLLVRELEDHGRLSLRRYYARAATRRLPLIGLVLLATALLTWWSGSVTATFGWDVVAAALQVVNWVLAGRSAGLLAEDAGASPIQHLWAVAVGAQFSVVWPLLLVLVGWLVRRSGRLRLRPAVTAATLLLVLPSFAWSVRLSQAGPDVAVLLTTTRVWELGVGALVAIGAARWQRLGRTASAVLGWGGLAAVLLSALVLSSDTPWPGPAALLPTLGAAAVVIAGYGPHGPARLLARRPAVRVGGLSYSLYLWHWPLLVTATALWGELGAGRGLLVVAAAVVPAYLGHRLVEKPVRLSGPVARSTPLALSVGANFALVGVVVGLALVLTVPTSGPGAAATGAGALEGGRTDGAGSVASLAGMAAVTPVAARATEDLPRGYEDGCSVGPLEAAVITCEYGDLDGETVVAVVGDSKVFQWQSALDAIGEGEGWRVVYFIKSSCPFTSAVPVVEGEVNDRCVSWNQSVRDALEDLAPDAVVTSQRHGRATASAERPEERTADAMEDGLVDTWQYLGSLGVPVVVLLDNPAPSLEVYACVAEHPTALERCVFDREGGVRSSAAPTQRAAAERVPTADVVDLTDEICPAELCVPVIGNVLVYRQGSHLTDTYVRTLVPALSAQLVPLVEEYTG